MCFKTLGSYRLDDFLKNFDNFFFQIKIGKIDRNKKSFEIALYTRMLNFRTLGSIEYEFLNFWSP